MRSIIPKTALVDSGFWFALLEARDQHYEHAQREIDTIERLRSVIIPWPILYESLGTRHVRQTNRQSFLRDFERIIKRPNVIRLDDAKYREDALSVTWDAFRPLSLVDNVLRLIIEDSGVKVDCIFTFNTADFVDICTKYQVEMILQNEQR